MPTPTGISIGSLLAGAMSWFGGPHDPTAGTGTASGQPTSVPGIAVYDQHTLGGWWLLKAPNGNIGIVQQTDIGPAPSTGRKFDYTYSLLPLFGYSETNFPTGGQTQGYYLGSSSELATGGGGAGSALQIALGKLKATKEQAAVITQAVDVGALTVGTHPGNAVVAPSGQKPGTTLPGSGQSPSGSSAQPAGITPGTFTDPLSAIADALSAIASLLTSGQFWLRLLEGLAGALLVYLGLHAITGQSSGAGQQVKHVTRIIPV
jgi:hypothetical protein